MLDGSEVGLDKSSAVLVVVDTGLSVADNELVAEVANRLDFNQHGLGASLGLLENSHMVSTSAHVHSLHGCCRH